jgi:hypothetical protein
LSRAGPEQNREAPAAFHGVGSNRLLCVLSLSFWFLGKFVEQHCRNIGTGVSG